MPRRTHKKAIKRAKARAVKAGPKPTWPAKTKFRYHYMPPDAKRALAYMVFAIALAVGLTAFYDLAYYSTAYAVVAGAPSYTLTAADASGGTASSANFTLQASFGEPAVGTAQSGCSDSTAFKIGDTKTVNGVTITLVNAIYGPGGAAIITAGNQNYTMHDWDSITVGNSVVRVDSIATMAGTFADVNITVCGSPNYVMTLGAIVFTAGDTTAPTCTIAESTGTPPEGAMVTLTASCSDDTELSKITLYTDESGTLTAINSYGSPASVSGNTKNVSFVWNNPAIKKDTTVLWKVVATDSSGNEGDSATLAFTVGAAPDMTKPVVDKPTASLASPSAGAKVTISAQTSDDRNLASASLSVNGNVVDSTTITGTAATASFEWVPTQAGTYSIKVLATDSAGNTAESEALSLDVLGGACQSEKPADVLGDCINGYQTVTTYVCDPTTGTWKPLMTEQACTAAPPIAFVAVGVVALAVALGSALYVLKTRKPAAKGKKVPEAPATFG